MSDSGPQEQQVIQTERKDCAKRRNCSLQTISPFATCFLKACFLRASKRVIVWEWVNGLQRCIKLGFVRAEHKYFLKYTEKSLSVWPY